MKAVLYDDNNIITNIIVWDSESLLDGQNHIVVEDDVHVSIGWKLVDGKFQSLETEIKNTYKSYDQIIQEQQALITALTARIAALEGAK